MKAFFLVAALTATPVLGDMPMALSESNRYYLLTELNRTPAEEVIQTASEKRDTRRIVRSDRRKPVFTFLTNRVKNLKWHPVGNTVRKLRNKE